MFESKPNLRDMQSWLRWAITDPRGVTQALKDPQPEGLGARYQAPQVGLENWIVGAGLDVYAEGYFSRVLDVLMGDFVGTHRQVGDTPFKNMVAEYLKAYPSNFSNIHEVGRYFAEFVTHSIDCGGSDWLPDLVQLEWKMVESHYAGLQHPVDPQRLVHLAEHDFSMIRLVFAGSLRLVFSRYELDFIKDGRGDLSPRELRAFVIHRNQSGYVDVDRAELEEGRLLTELMKGSTLSQSLCLAEVSVDSTAERFSSWFQTWLKKGLIVAFNI